MDKRSKEYKLLMEASLLLYEAQPAHCPKWEYGKGDCNKPDCLFCRIRRWEEKKDDIKSYKRLDIT